MKKVILFIGIAIALMAMLSIQSFSQSTVSMKLNAGIITPKLKENKEFYQRVLNFEVVFENDFYLLMSTANGTSQISFLLPNHQSQQPLFRPAFGGKGVYLTIEVEKVEQEYQRIKKLGVSVAIDLRKEPWGDQHFAIEDPNGVGIDIVTYSQPEKE